MIETEFLDIIHNDEFYNYLLELRKMFSKELKYDFEIDRIGSNINCYNNGRYEVATAIYDNYLYYLEKKYNIGRGKHE